MFIAPEFWLFMGSSLALYYFVPRRWQNVSLLLSSYAIYAYFDWRFCGLLIGSTLINHLIGRRLAPGSPRRRVFLAIGILWNVAVLAFFKYVSFFSVPITQALSRLGIVVDPGFLTLALPLGLSFYSFRGMSYLFDVAAGRVPPAERWVDLALYVAFFPQIAAGPIERAARFLPRLKETRRLSQEQIVEGASCIFVGLFYKTVIADPLVLRTEHAFSAIAQLSAPEALVTMALYSIRLYADFAGYSAMAIGISTWFGLPAMENFRQPYFSQSVIEFWTRWHISLSSWFRDYVFFPLSRALISRFGTKRSFGIQIFSLFLTMLLTGIWHGGTLLFVIWGMLHGLYTVLERLINEPRTPPARRDANSCIRTLGNILTTQLAVAAAWVFFRATSLSDALLFFQRLLSADYRLDKTWIVMLGTSVTLLAIFDASQLRLGKLIHFWNLALAWRVAVVGIMLLAIIICSGGFHSGFVYTWF